MSRRLLPVCLLVAACAHFESDKDPGSSPPVRPASGKRLPFPPSSAKPDFWGRLPQVRWAHDGKHLERTEDKKKVWVDPRTGATRPAEEERWAGSTRAELAAAHVAAFKTPAKQAAALVRRVQVSKDRNVLLLAAGPHVDLFRKGKGWTRLTTKGVRWVGPRLSPDGKRISYLREHQLRLFDIASGKESRLTEDGDARNLYGRLDWVYQEEVYGRGRWNAMWWSPDSTTLAFLHIDGRAVPEYTILDHLPRRPRAAVSTYPKAGDPNPKARLGVASLDGSVRWIDLGSYGDEFLIVRVDWTPDSRRVFFQIQDRIQTWLDLNAADPATGTWSRLFREESETWVNVLGPPRWLQNGSFLWLSERTGLRHVYHYAGDGKLIRALTAGTAPVVRRVLRADLKKNRVLFSGYGREVTRSHAYAVKMDGGGLRRLTEGCGTHRVALNGDGTLLLDRFSCVGRAPELRLVDLDGKASRSLGRAEPKGVSEYAFAKTELLKIPARDGVELDALLTRPPDFDPTRSYPVWLQTYSGPNAPSVRDRWDGSAWTQFLAQQGLLLLRVNVRSASGRGQVDTAACYRQLGVVELRDLEDAVRWLVAHPWADGERVGITGWSYGGFMAAYALTQTKLFRLGIAGAGVYDWRLYDTIYTERYMRTPKENPEGYKRTSCIAAAKNLHGHLVLIHGSQDDNVHLQNAIQFAYALQKAKKPFDLMVYPRSGHGVRDRDLSAHLRALTWRAIQEHLLGRRGETTPGS